MDPLSSTSPSFCACSPKRAVQTGAILALITAIAVGVIFYTLLNNPTISYAMIGVGALSLMIFIIASASRQASKGHQLQESNLRFIGSLGGDEKPIKEALLKADCRFEYAFVFRVLNGQCFNYFEGDGELKDFSFENHPEGSILILMVSQSPQTDRYAQGYDLKVQGQYPPEARNSQFFQRKNRLDGVTYEELTYVEQHHWLPPRLQTLLKSG